MSLNIDDWRAARRAELIEARLDTPVAERSALAGRIADELDELIPATQQTLVSIYWPFRGEPDLREWMGAMYDRGARIALPVVVKKGRPLIFREWTPDVRMERGVWNIPIPSEGPEVIPNVTIAPLVGFDAGCYRLGYGGGFFDRTLAGMEKRPRVIGIGSPAAELPTIHPQPHDIPMDVIVTGDGRTMVRGQ